MNSDEKQILEVNNRFYEALGSRDIELMRTVFVQNKRAGCTHPGWIMLEGWDAIMQSWENVFDPKDTLDVRLHNLTVDIVGDSAWVTCVQEIIYIKREPMMMNVSISTNIFERTESGWLMVIHQASPIPFEATEDVEDRKLQ